MPASIACVGGDNVALKLSRLYTLDMWKVIAVVLSIIAIAGSISYLAYTYYLTEASKPYTGLTWFTVKPEDVPPSPAATSTTSTPQTWTVTAVASSSITVQDNTSKASTVYKLTKDTQVYTLVAVGQTGKALSDIVPGTRVKLAALENDPHTLFWIAFARDASLEPTQEETLAPNRLQGVVSAVTANSITVSPASSTPVTVTISPTTQVLYRVLAGETAQPAQVGKTAAVVWGADPLTNPTKARIIILSPILKK